MPHFNRRQVGFGLIAAACPGMAHEARAAEDAMHGGTLTTWTPGFRTLNSAVQSGAATGVPASQLFAGLVLMDAAFRPQPYLARHWTISDDEKTYTFQLIGSARFHDGTPITAEDVA